MGSGPQSFTARILCSDFAGLLTVREKIEPDDLSVPLGLISGLNGRLRAGRTSQRGQVEHGRTLPVNFSPPQVLRQSRGSTQGLLPQHSRQEVGCRLEGPLPSPQGQADMFPECLLPRLAGCPAASLTMAWLPAPPSIHPLHNCLSPSKYTFWNPPHWALVIKPLTDFPPPTPGSR